jgi:hypothetical protein
MPAHVNNDLPEASPMIITETPTHVVIACEISKGRLRQCRRFLEALLAIATHQD